MGEVANGRGCEWANGQIDSFAPAILILESIGLKPNAIKLSHVTLSEAKSR